MSIIWANQVARPCVHNNQIIIIIILDASDNSNSSCDSDQLQRSDPSYHGKSDVHQRGGIPVHRNESISISDMEKYATDVEVRSPVSLFKVIIEVSVLLVML